MAVQNSGSHCGAVAAAAVVAVAVAAAATMALQELSDSSVKMASSIGWMDCRILNSLVGMASLSGLAAGYKMVLASSMGRQGMAECLAEVVGT